MNDNSVEILGPVSITFNLKPPEPKKVIHSGNKTIVLWKDGTKTVVTCAKDDKYDNYTGFIAALAKKTYGSASRINEMLEPITDDRRRVSFIYPF